MDLPVGICHRHQKGIDSLSDLREPQHVTTLYQALTTAWPFDAWFTTYQVVDAGGQFLPAWPRINQPALPHIRTAGGDVRVGCLVLDYDLPGHAEWSSGDPDRFLAYLSSFEQTNYPLPARFSAAYTTRGGARLIWVLSRPIKPEVVAGKLRGLIQVVRDATGIQCDPKCIDWTRLFRLPCVERDGKRTHEQRYFRFALQPQFTLDPSMVPDVGPATAVSVAGVRLEVPLPSPEQCYLELYRLGEGGRYIHTEWFRDAAARLRGRECERVLKAETILQPGQRNDTLMRAVGEACAMLSIVESTTPEKVYALFDGVVSQLEGDEDTPDWRACVWSMVLRMWGKELAKREASTASRKAFVDEVLEGMRKWCEHPGLFQDRTSSIQWMISHSILCHGKSYYILRPDGHFDSIGVGSQQIHARVRELGMGEIIEVERKTDQGIKELAIQTLINRYSTMIRHVEGTISIPKTMVRDIETERATLMIRMYSRKNLEPLFNRQVEEWLQSWCDTQEDFDDLCAWIGHALNFEGGAIAALSLAGPPGCGKKMLMMGLVECLEHETWGDEREFGQFQYAIGRSPFLFVNEGLPRRTPGHKDVADTFRHYVGGDPIQVVEKFQPPKIVRNPLRIIFAANNLDVLSGLYGHRDLTPEDRDALAQRILHINISPHAGDYLRARGGHRLTGQYLNRWIRGDDGAESNYVVARHFMWLWANRPPAPHGSRFLVEGRMEPELIRAMSTRSGSAPLVIEAVIGMIESKVKPEGIELDEDTGLIRCTTSSVVDWYYAKMSERGTKLNHHNVGSVFKGLGSKGSRIGSFKSDSMQKRRFHELDPEKLLGEALEHGYKCDTLKRLYGKMVQVRGLGA